MKYYTSWLFLTLFLSILIFGIAAAIVWTAAEFSDYQKIIAILLTGTFSGVMLLTRLVLAGIDQLFEEFGQRTMTITMPKPKVGCRYNEE